MAGMTGKELEAFVSDIVGKQAGEAVRQAFEKHAEAFKAQQSDWVKSLMAGGDKDPVAPTAPADKLKSAERAGRIIRAVGAAQLHQRGGDGPTNPLAVLDKWGDKELAKAMAASSAADGGHLIPSQLSTDIIELLRPASIVRRLGPNSVPMPNGSIRIPKVGSGSSAAYQGENANIAASQLALGQVIMTFKKLTALVPASNDLLRYAGPGAVNADALIRDDVVRAIAQRESQAFLRDDGTASTPKGIKAWAPAANLHNSAGTTLANMVTDLSTAILDLMNANIPEGRWVWMLNPRSYMSLYTVQNTNGFFVFRDEMSRGMLWGFPFAFTTQLPGSGSTGEYYLVNMADAMIGEAMNLIVDVSMEASYIDATSGSLVSAYSLDQSIVRAITEHDFAMRRAESVSVIQALSY